MMPVPRAIRPAIHVILGAGFDEHVRPIMPQFDGQVEPPFVRSDGQSPIDYRVIVESGVIIPDRRPDEDLLDGPLRCPVVLGDLRRPPDAVDLPGVEPTVVRR